MAFYLKSINRASPETIFVSVTNADSVTASTGHAVIWDHVAGQTTGLGYQIRISRTTSTSAPNPGLFAGIVAGADIPPSSMGSVQVYGYCDSVILSGVSTGFNGATLGQTAWDNATLSQVILRPVGALGTSAGANTSIGYLGVCQLPTQLGVATNADAVNLRALWPGGYVVPVDSLYNVGGTTAQTMTFTSSASCKAFIRALC